MYSQAEVCPRPLSSLLFERGRYVSLGVVLTISRVINSSITLRPRPQVSAKFAQNPDCVETYFPYHP